MADDVLVASEDEVSADDDESSEELLAQESIRLKANAKIVGKKRNFSFVIEPKLCAGYIIIYSKCMSIKHYTIEIKYMMIREPYKLFSLKSSCNYR